MKYYEEAPEREDAIIGAYITAVKKNAKYADEGFLAYATDPKNIVVHKSIACYLTATYDISLWMTYRHKSYYEHTKGLNVEARSDKLYVSKDTEWRSYETNDFRTFDHTVTKSFVGKSGDVSATDARTSRKLTRLDPGGGYEQHEKIKTYFREAGFDGESDFFDHINKFASSPDLYRDEVSRAKEEIRDSVSEVTDINVDKVRVSNLRSYADDVALTFGYVYTVGVTYAGKQYYGTYAASMSDVPFKYSQKALDDAKDRAETVKSVLARKRRTDTIVYVCALLVGLIVFALTIVFSLSEELSARYSASWIRFFTLFPYSLIVLIPLVVLTVAYALVRTETAYRIDEAERKLPSDESAWDLIDDAMTYGLRARKIFLYVMAVVMVLYVVFQAVAFIWGPSFPVPQGGSDGPGDIGNTYTIATAEDLEKLPDDYEGRVELTADIDLGGRTFDGIDNFSGTFDGNGHTISDFTIVARDSVRNCGFFVYIDENATVSDLTLSDVTCDGGINVGVFAGLNSGRITNCAVTDCRLAGDDQVGSIVGENSGAIEKSFAENVTVEMTSTGVTGQAGGIAGLNGGTITNCYTEAYITARTNAGSDMDIGGLTGYNAGRILNSYFVGDIEVTGFSATNARTGGLAGYNRYAVTGCWYDSEYVTDFGTCSSDGEFESCYSLSELAEEYGSREHAIAQTVGSVDWLSGTLYWDVGVWTADGSGYPKLIDDKEEE